jgi:hypothetical protein
MKILALMSPPSGKSQGAIITKRRPAAASILK